MQGRLYLIGTPIGNLSDISPRALETLRSLNRLYCEDTRVTSKLLSHFGIKLPLHALSDDMPASKWAQAVKAVTVGQQVGFCCDAGMPGVSDPGRKLVREAWKKGVVPIVIPGPSSVGALLAACPFVGQSFRFRGFAPRKKNERTSFIDDLVSSLEPSMFFEAPQRIHKFLDERCLTVEPEREIMIGREMTKMHEQIALFQASEWDDISEKVPEIGEFTVAVAPLSSPPPSHEDSEITAAFERLLTTGFSKRDAVKALAAAWDISPNDIKRLTYGG